MRIDGIERPSNVPLWVFSSGSRVAKWTAPTEKTTTPRTHIAAAMPTDARFSRVSSAAAVFAVPPPANRHTSSNDEARSMRFSNENASTAGDPTTIAMTKPMTTASPLHGLSIPSILIFGALGALKLHCANVVRSPAMRKDGICSAAGAVLSFAVCLGVTAWWIDPVVAMTVALSLFVFGFRTLRKNYLAGNRWWTAEWWGMPGRPTPHGENKAPGMELTRSGHADA